jgi:hypothetical protein
VPRAAWPPCPHCGRPGTRGPSAPSRPRSACLPAGTRTRRRRGLTSPPPPAALVRSPRPGAGRATDEKSLQKRHARTISLRCSVVAGGHRASLHDGPFQGAAKLRQPHARTAQSPRLAAPEHAVDAGRPPRERQGGRRQRSWGRQGAAGGPGAGRRRLASHAPRPSRGPVRKGLREPGAAPDERGAHRAHPASRQAGPPRAGRLGWDRQRRHEHPGSCARAESRGVWCAVRAVGARSGSAGTDAHAHDARCGIYRAGS